MFIKDEPMQEPVPPASQSRAASRRPSQSGSSANSIVSAHSVPRRPPIEIEDNSLGGPILLVDAPETGMVPIVQRPDCGMVPVADPCESSAAADQSAPEQRIVLKARRRPIPLRSFPVPFSLRCLPV